MYEKDYAWHEKIKLACVNSAKMPQLSSKMGAKMIIYGLKNCDSCRKALKALPGAVLVDVRDAGVPEDVMDAALAQYGEALVNTRSTTWRQMDAAAREGAPKDLLEAHPTLMKRPLIAVDRKIYLSWNNKIEAELKATL
jgi:arsenate reductase